MKERMLLVLASMRLFYWRVVPSYFIVSLDGCREAFIHSSGKRKKHFANRMLEEVRVLFPVLRLTPYEIASASVSYVLWNKYVKLENTYSVERLYDDPEFRLFVSKQKSVSSEKVIQNNDDTVDGVLNVVEIEKQLVEIHQRTSVLDAKEITMIVNYFKYAA